MLKFKKIAIEGLKAACSKTQRMILLGQWTNLQIKTEIAMQALVDWVVHHTLGISDAILTAMRGDAASLEAFRTTLSKDQNFTKQLPDPSTWTYPKTEIRDLIDNIMHQLFLGVTKTFYKGMVITWLKLNGKGAPYLRSLLSLSSASKVSNSREPRPNK